MLMILKCNDNRMGWIRNIERIGTNESESYYAEYELASDSCIQSIIDFVDGMILCAPMTFEKDARGLYKYCLKIKFAQSGYIPDYNKATTKGYLFRGDIHGELIALFSLFFQCRFYLLAAFSGDLTRQGIKTKREYAPIYRPCFPNFDPTVFPDGRRSFADGLSGFLERVSKIPEEYHQQLILAANHYAMALREFRINEEMVFIRLVSAIEALSKWAPPLKKADDLFYGRSFDEIVNTKCLSDEETAELKKIFEVRKSKLKFIRFIEYYSKRFFKGGNYRAPHTCIKKRNLIRVLSAIYDSRSGYLHNGETMYLSQPMRAGQKWDTDPSAGMVIDNRKFSSKKKLPYGAYFQRLVRHCLLEFIREKSLNETEKSGGARRDL